MSNSWTVVKGVEDQASDMSLSSFDDLTDSTSLPASSSCSIPVALSSSPLLSSISSSPSSSSSSSFPFAFPSANSSASSVLSSFISPSSSSSSSSTSSFSSLEPNSSHLQPLVRMHIDQKQEKEDENIAGNNNEEEEEEEEEVCDCCSGAPHDHLPSSISTPKNSSIPLAARHSLFDIVEKNDIAALTLALREPRVNVNRPMHGKVLLSFAAKRGFLECAQLLLKRGKANVNLADANGNTPLLYAATEGNMPLLQLLLQAGADATIRNNNGWNALMTASFYGHDPAVEYLSSLPECSVDQDSYDGSTSLMLAATAGKLSVVKMLILKGADAKCMNRKGLVVYNFVPRLKGVSQTDLQACILTSLADRARMLRLCFLLGGHARIGSESSVRSLLQHPVFDPETLRELSMNPVAAKYLMWTNFGIGVSALSFQLTVLYPWHMQLDRDFVLLKQEQERKLQTFHEVKVQRLSYIESSLEKITQRLDQLLKNKGM